MWPGLVPAGGCGDNPFSRLFQLPGAPAFLGSGSLPLSSNPATLPSHISPQEAQKASLLLRAGVMGWAARVLWDSPAGSGGSGTGSRGEGP